MSESAAEEVDSSDEATGRAPTVQEISGGAHGAINMGGQYGQYIQTLVNKIYSPVDTSEKHVNPGTFRIASFFTVLEKEPISLSSRVFGAVQHSDVTGDRQIVVKITPANKKHEKEAKIHFVVPSHRNIVERIATDTFNFRGQPSIYIAMERCDCNLHEYIKSQKEDEIPFDPEKYQSIAHQIVIALEFLHRHKVIHGDLKPTNVLIVLKGMVVKLADFGLSKAITPGHDSTAVTSPHAGTMGWQAPEVLKGTEIISTATDIFPLGLVLYYTWSYGNHPFGDKLYSLNHFIAEGIDRDLSRLLISNSKNAELLLESTLDPDPAKRPSTIEILHCVVFSKGSPVSPKVTDSKLLKIMNDAAEDIGTQINQPTKGPSTVDKDKITELGVTVNQLSNVLENIFDRKKLDVPSDTPVSPADVTLEGVLAQAMEIVKRRVEEPSNEGHSKSVINLNVTIEQLANAMKEAFEKTQVLPFGGSKGRNTIKRRETLRKSDISQPQDLRLYRGWDSLDPAIRDLFAKGGCPRNVQLNDKKAVKFILDFVEKNGGVDGIKEILRQETEQSPASRSSQSSVILQSSTLPSSTKKDKARRRSLLWNWFGSATLERDRSPPQLPPEGLLSSDRKGSYPKQLQHTKSLELTPPPSPQHRRQLSQPPPTPPTSSKRQQQSPLRRAPPPPPHGGNLPSTSPSLPEECEPSTQCSTTQESGSVDV